MVIISPHQALPCQLEILSICNYHWASFHCTSYAVYSLNLYSSVHKTGPISPDLCPIGDDQNYCITFNKLQCPSIKMVFKLSLLFLVNFLQVLGVDLKSHFFTPSDRLIKYPFDYVTADFDVPEYSTQSVKKVGKPIAVVWKESSVISSNWLNSNSAILLDVMVQQLYINICQSRLTSCVFVNQLICDEML